MAIYKVEFIETLGDETYSTYLHLPAKSEKGAKAKTLQIQRNLASKYHPTWPFELTIVSVTRIRSEEEQILEGLWNIFPDLYYKLWEPGIRTKTMVYKLKTDHPEEYCVLADSEASRIFSTEENS